MSLISSAIPNLINGVSQQPYALRLSSQCELQENGYSSVVEGLRKRPPFKHQMRITSAPSGEIFTHIINRDESERYLVLIGGGDLRVYDLLSMTERTVNFPTGKTYLSTTSPASTFKAVTVADYTFILNKGVTVAQGSTLSPTRNPEAVLWIKQGTYGCKYAIYINGSLAASYTTPTGSSASDSQYLATDYIAAQLMTGLTSSNITSANGWITKVNGSSIYISRATDFTISITDGQGDQATKAVKGKSQRFTDLPAKGFDGLSVEVVGDQSSNFDNYYVRYQDDAGMSSGSWVESLKGGESLGLNASTMPHVLVRESNGTFTFKAATWNNRLVGDLDSNPMPSFVTRKMNDIFFHRNRLGFVSDENVIFSRAGDFFNFFRSSATDVLDTDPIDVAVSHVKVSILQHAIPFNETLLLFSDQTQFMVKASESLTPKTISINQTTEFECALQSKPVGAGQNVYFAVNRGDYSAFREYYIQPDTQTNDATDVTSHVPKYVSGNITKIAASTNESALVALSGDDRDRLFIYKFYWNQNEKLQSSWSVWTFSADDTILSVDFIESEIWAVIKRADGVFMESAPLNPGATYDDNLGFPFHLDRQVSQDQCTVSYDSATNTTSITIPYAVTTPSDFQLVGGFGDPARKCGSVIPYSVTGTSVDNKTTIQVSGNLQKFVFGRSYIFRYRFSTLVIKEDAQGGGQRSVGNGRLQLRRLTVNYDKSGYFRAEVTPLNRQTYRYVFSGRIVGSASNQIGSVALESGKFSFPIMSKNDQAMIDIINDTPLPCALLSADWEAMYVTRDQRV